MGGGADEVEEWLRGIPSLVRVIPVGLELQMTGGGRTIVTSVEIWSTLVLVRLAYIAQDVKPAAQVDLSALAAPEMDDNAGTKYTLLGAGWSGGELVQTGDASFTPRPPGDASVLHLRFPRCRDSVTVVLRP